MKEYWYQIKIADIKKVPSGCGGSFIGNDIHEYFTVEMKDGIHHQLHFISHEGKREGSVARLELNKLYNEYNGVPETYLLENEAYAVINGTFVSFGCRTEDNLGKYQTFTLKEIDELRKQFKIRDEGWRHLAGITMLRVEGTKVVFPDKIPQRYLDQLVYMGYDISLLTYEVKQDE